MVGMRHNTYGNDETGEKPKNVKRMINLGTYDYFFYGHLHYLNFKLPSSHNKTIAINPGGLYEERYSTVCILLPQERILEVFFYHAHDFRNILRFRLNEGPIPCSIILDRH